MALTMNNAREATTPEYTFSLELSDGTLEWSFDEKTTRQIISILDGYTSKGTPTPAPTPHNTPSPAPKSESRTITPAKDLYVSLTVKDNMILPQYVAKAPNAVLSRILRNAGFTWDPDAIIDPKNVYKKDSGSHKKGDVKTGAYVLMKGSKRDLAGTKKFILDNCDDVGSPKLFINAGDIEAERQKIAQRIARRRNR